ncbi:MAG: hypothetical protein MJ179_02415, partial [Treponema sp.]|nr:hypothetical protein [Treponema sp.]
CLEQNKDGTIRPCEVMKDNEELEEIRAQQARIINNDTKRTERLKAQIEKMKCCTTCVNHTFYIPQVDRLVKGKDDTKCENCIHYSLNKLENYRKGKELVDKWELAE